MFNSGTCIKNILMLLFIPLFSGCMKATLTPLVSENEVFRKIKIQSGTTVALEEGIGHQISLAIETPVFNGIKLKPITLHWSLNDHDGDFETSSGTLIIQPGATSISFMIKALRDSEIENDETFELTFSGDSFSNLEDSTISFIVKDRTTKAKVRAEFLSLDFGPQQIQNTVTRAVIFSNSGDATAENLSFTTPSPPFAYHGGSFPGVGGTCGGVLKGHNSCSVVLSYTPSEVNTHNESLTWSYKNPITTDQGNLNITGLGVEVAAILGGQPSQPSNVDNLNITVSGTNVTHYKYKLGPALSTDCSLSAGYSVETATSTKITDDLQLLANQNLKVCVIGKDTNNFWQPLSAATQYSWNYDTTRPTVSINQKVGQADPTNTLPVRFTMVFSEPIAESSLSESDVHFIGSASVQNYTLTKIDSTHYELVVTALDHDGIIEPVIGEAKFSDLAGNLNSASTSTDNQVTYDTSAPNAATLLGWLQSSPSKSSPVTAKWTVSTSTDIHEQKIQFYKDASCLVLSGSAISLPASTTNANLTGLDGETYSYNVTSMDTAGNISVSSCSSSLLIDRTLPSVTSFTPATSIQASLPTSITVSFSEAMLESTIENINNYTVTCNSSGTASIVGASALSASTAVLNLNVTQAPANAETCTVTVKTAVTDLAGNSLSSAAVATYVLDLPGFVIGVNSSLANGIYKANQVVPITITFSENVFLADGSPKLLMETGAIDRLATYVSGHGTNALLFHYTVVSGDNTADLDYESASALSLNGSTLKDSFGSDIILTLPAPSTPGSLSANKNIEIDTQAPDAFNITGITGGTDSTKDEWLTNGSIATAHWSPALGSSHYLVEIRNADASLNICAQQSVSTTSATFTGCNLINNTQYLLRVSALDTVGNATAASNNDFIFTINTSAVIATLTGQPSGRTNQTVLNIDVDGVDVQSYRYKVGASASTNCAVATGYSSDISSTINITDSVNALGNTDIKVCVIGKNSASVEQALTSATSATWTQDLIAPTLTLNQKSGQPDPTNTLPVEFTIVASEAITGFDVSDITQSGTATGITWTLSSSDNITWSLKATAVTGAGTLIPSIGVNKLTDIAGNSNAASTSTDNHVTYETTKPSLTINQKSGQSDPTNTLPIDFTIVFSEPINPSTFTTADITQGGSASGITWNLSTLDNITWSLSATAVTTAGTLIPSIGAGKVNDPAGNSNNASTSTDASVTYDITPPVNAVSLSWQQSSPTNSTSLVAQWTKSTSTDLSSQKIRFYTGASCNTYTGTENTATSSATTSNFTAAHGNTYTYQVISTDTAGNSITSACSSALTIDTIAPTITNVTSNKANGAYTVGEVIDIRITFSENVTVTGTPLLALNTTPTRTASYVSGSTTSTLVFNYTVQASDTASDLNYVATNSLTITSASIKDAATNNAVLTLPGIASAGSLGTNKDIVIDTTPPSITTFTVTNSTPTNSTTFNISSSVNGSPTSYCIRENSPTVASCSWVAGSVLPASFTVTTTNEAKTLYAWVKDTAGNISAMASSASIVFDNIPPTATLSGQPTGSSAKYALNIDVSGSGVVGYKYKMGPSASIDCTVASGYSSSEVSETINIVENIAAYANGSVKLCVVGKDAAGNWQTYAAATSAVWTKNSPAIQFTTTASSVSEYNDPTHTVAVSIPTAVDIAVSVQYTFSDGANPSATMGDDYIAVNGTATIAAGSTSVNISIPILDNSTEEYDETFKITLSAPVGGSLGTNTVHTVTILDDEEPPLVTIQDVFVTEGESTSLIATISHPTDKGAVKITWTRDACVGVDCAIAGTDYTMAVTSGTASIPSGNTSISFGNLVTIDNAIDELYKRVPIKITGVTGGTSYISNADIYINDNDSPLGKQAVQIETGDYHSCSLDNSGSVYCWGLNDNGQLGVGNYRPSSSPLKVNLPSAASSIAAKYGNACAITSAGALYCWGRGSNASFPGASLTGTNSTGNRWTPTAVTGMSSGVTGVGIGYVNSCALQNGTVYCWGAKDYGVLGDPNAEFSTLVPVPISGLPPGVEKIAMGWVHACALKAGSVYCWGENKNGEVGDGTFNLVHTPKIVSGIGTTKNLWAGLYGTCTKNTNDQVYCWGNNGDHQIHSLSTADVNTPTLMPELSGATVVTYGYQSCAIINGQLLCKGKNYFGEAGINQPTGSLNVPLSPVIGASSGVTDVAVSHGAHTCYIRNSQVYCSGFSGFGQLGDQQTLQSNAHVLSPDFTNAASISMITEHACGIYNGGVKCLGDNSHSKVGNLLTDRIYLVPTAVKTMETGVSKIKTAIDGSCALQNGSVKCWGRAYIRGHSSGSGNPNTPLGLSSGATDLASSLGSQFVCAIASGKVYCWGFLNNWSIFNLQVGVHYKDPVEIVEAGSNNKQISLGAYHGCLLKTDKTVWCSGYNNEGQLGRGHNDNSNTNPMADLLQIPGLTNVDEISTATYGTCARIGSTLIKCWGNSPGHGSSTRAIATPAEITGFTNITKLISGNNNHCIISNGKGYCWGFNRFDNHGINDYLTNEYHYSPTALDSLNAFGAVTDIEITNSYGSCGKVGNNWYCSAIDSKGQFGTDKKPFRLAPISIAPFPN